MAICLFTRKGYDGSGDVVQTVKIADFIQKFIESSELEELKNEAVIIVVKDDENKEIASRFVKDINCNIQVKKISELKEENHKISCCIEAGYSHFDWEKELSFTGTKPPIIVMPEYNNDVNRKSLLRILGGFDKERGDVGVIPSPLLLAATAGEEISAEVLQNAFERLDAKIQSYLGKDVESYLAQREQRDNRTKSDRWDKRFDAASQLFQLTKDNNVISQEDTSFVTAQLAIIKQNEPSWQERSLITKILDILSLGIIPISWSLEKPRSNTSPTPWACPTMALT